MSQTRLTVSSPAFTAGERIPKAHAHAPEGENVSPPLAWQGVPSEARELALVVDDPDAPRAEPWVHWVVYGIPSSADGLPAGAASGPGLPAGARQGENDFGETGWGGPLPPPGHGAHHYHFKLYVLDTRLGLEAGASKDDLLRAMKGHVVAEGELVGTYSR